MAITTGTDRIRELNDKLRQNLSTGYAVITPGVAALGQEAVERLVKTTTPTILTRNTTLARLMLTATRSFSRSTTTTKHYRCTRRTLLTPRLPSV